MESASSEDEGSLRDNHVDLNNENMEHHLAMEGSGHFNDSESLLPSHEEASENIEPFIGMEFESEEAAKESYMSYASRVGFSVRISKSRRSRNDESIIMRRFVCSKEGFHMKKSNYEDGKKKRKRATIREGCNAMIEVIQKYYGRWVVTKLVKEHNHVISAPSRVRYIAPEEYAGMEPFVGMEFSSHETAQMFYYAYAARTGFDVRIRLSRRSTRDESFVMRRFVCTKEGYSTYEENFDDSKKKRNRTPTREGCKAMFEVIKKDSDRWIVSKLVTEHTHDLVIAPGKVHYIQSQSEVVVLAKSGAVTREKSAALTNSKPRFGDKIGRFDSLSSNDQGSRADLTNSCQNSFEFEESQFLLETLKKMQAENPAFFYAFQVDKNNCLINVFWADAKAKMAYYCFGDAVTVDTSHKENKNVMPFVMFTGVNHHCQSVTFGCALLTDDSEASFIWLFENWLVAMCGRPPISLITDHHEAMAAAISSVFPDACHRLSRYHILRKCRERLSNLYFIHGSLETSFEMEFLKCIDEPETVQVFELQWKSILDKYDLGENTWLQFLHSIRHKWVPVYHKGTFTADISLAEKPESLSMFFEKYFNKKMSLQVFISILDQAIAVWYEREALEDFASSYTRPSLKTPSSLLKQAAEIYTRTIFDAFQDEFVESLGYFADKIEDGVISKYTVTKDVDACTCLVTHDSSDERTSCSCFKFERSGILCRHILRVYLTVDVRIVPEHYILKRWTKDAKNGFVLDECARYSDLVCQVIRFSKE
ncbi:protein FAR1-RELATED SEQUENCE 5-like [Phalaenopsis equestris]|uniref:protein FAR1-RELATED SEQUENCE 5-like n=1 Tax=Phalaenopsis equestris TaxID=78828 RepID=UPI0009E3673C|nr:protein FAR1-RELATED SEQUENCE 5-like [Phalaenopsis equestris]XP_020586090.1 protein FAR1-RELATED SEQUENCE 5-like [Phalaenopsis equestris]XP_020586091.1 protein FAR1-RELATED SEQUENCE 5-like [Phalaenopsis equestris]